MRIRIEKIRLQIGENDDRPLLVRPYAGAHRKEFNSDANPFRPTAPGVYVQDDVLQLGDTNNLG